MPKDFGMAHKEMEFMPLSPAKRESYSVWYFIGFLFMFCVIASIINLVL